MKEGLNRVILAGNLGADPETRFTQGGQAVMNLRLAVSESYMDKEGVRKERTDWISCVMFGKRAEALTKILHKGSSVIVEGGIRTSSYEDKDGNKRYKTEVAVNNIVLADSGGRGASNYGTSGHGASAKHGTPPEEDAPF